MRRGELAFDAHIPWKKTSHRPLEKSLLETLRRKQFQNFYPQVQSGIQILISSALREIFALSA
jgi:hypothetical protein